MLGFNAISTNPISGELAQATYYYTASGSLNTGNNANYKLNLKHTASGGLTTGNTATVQPKYLYTGSGGLTTGNTATVQPKYLYIGSGGLTTGNNANYKLNLKHTASGSLNIGNSATVQPKYLYTASGSLNTGNTATVQPKYLYTASGSLNTGNTATVQPKYLYTGSGGLNIGDTATVQPKYLYTASGSLNIGNSATVQPKYLYTASGSLNIGNSAVVQPKYLYTASGGLNIGNTANSQPKYLYTGSGGLNIGNTANSQPKYLYTGSGGLNIGDTATVQPKYLYTGSGGLNIGNTTNSQLIYQYEAFGNLLFSGSATVQVQSSYYTATGAGKLSLGGSANIQISYFYNSSGNLNLNNTAPIQANYQYSASGNVGLNNSSNAKVIYEFISSEGLYLNNSSVTKNTYIYISTGNIIVGGFAGIVPPPPQSYSYIASGNLNTSIISEVTYIEFRPKSGYWEAIKDEIQKMRELRLICNDPISEYVFINQLRNDKIRQLIESANTWQVICYLGNSIYDIQVDGVRMEVSTNIQTPSTNIELETPTNQYNSIVSKKEETFLPNNIVLERIQNDRVKTMLLSPNISSWTAKIEDGKFRIILKTTGNDTLSVLIDPNTIVVTPTIIVKESANLAGSDIRESNITYISNEVVLARLQNERIKNLLLSSNIKNWFATASNENTVFITATTTNNDKINLSVNLDTVILKPKIAISNNKLTSVPSSKMTSTVSQEAALSIFGPTSFLNNLPRSDWKVLGFRDNKLEVQLKHGVIISK